MSEPLAVIRVPWDVSRTSLNQRLHWAERQRRNRAAREIARLAWLAAGAPMAAGPVEVAITVQRERVLDPDNALSGCKSLIDALFTQAITPRDSAAWVAFRPVEQETGNQWRGRAQVLFVVWDRADNEARWTGQKG